MPHRIAHAKSYPFAIPDFSFEVKDGRLRRLAPGDAHRAGRTAVIATGSNRSPERLKRKFADDPDGVATERARLAGFDVVYAAHITAYGSIPSTLQHVPGMAVELAVNWLTDRQLEAMHATEGNYDYVRLERIALDTEAGPALTEAHVYIAKVGFIVRAGAPVGMVEAAAADRPHGALDQEGAQALVHARLGKDGELDEFIRENIEDAGTRRARTERLAERAGGFTWPHWRMP